MNHAFAADDRAAQERLDVYVARSLALSRNAASKLWQTGDVTVGGRPERPSYLVQPGDEIVVTTPDAHPEPTMSAPELPIVYQDDQLLVIDKPAGIAAHPGNGTSGRPTVADFARLHTTDNDADRPGIVHRLDRDTSGLMIIAKNAETKARLQDLFRRHEVHKTYTLLVAGRLEPAEAVIQLPLDRDPTNPLRRAVVSGGKAAITRYRTVRDYPGYSLVEAEPQTGRTHQLRVHFATLGHPIISDSIYGQPERRLKLRRQFLHASRLRFTTLDGRDLDLHSELPADLTAVLQQLEETA